MERVSQQLRWHPPRRLEAQDRRNLRPELVVGDPETEIPVNLDAARAVATGYMSEDEISWLAEQASSHSRIVEIGSWTGRSTLALAQNTQGTVWAIDNWLGSAGDLDDIIHARGIDWAFDEFRRNLRDCSNVYVKRLDSILASTHFDPCVF